MEFKLEDRMFDHISNIIKFTEDVNKNDESGVLTEELITTGISAVSLYRESQSSDSRVNFIEKLRHSIGKFCRLQSTLLLIEKLEFDMEFDLPSLLGETDELLKILYKSVSTAKKNLVSEN